MVLETLQKERNNRLGASAEYKLLMQAWLVICLAIIATALILWGAQAVRAEPGDFVLLEILGVIWLVVARELFSWLGLSVRDDAVERRNSAAVFALCGAMLAVTLTFAGGNSGEGPSFFENILSAALATGTLLGFWLVLELSARVSVSIAEERDLASGLRLGGLLVAVGLMFGRAVAGDWHSVWGTIHDFIRDGWVGVLLLPVAILIERKFRPGRARPFPNWLLCGLLPALCYIAFAVICLWRLGPWEGLRK